MDFGIDTLVYIIIGVIFVLAQATRKRNLPKGKLPAAAQVVKEEAKEELQEIIVESWNNRFCFGIAHPAIVFDYEGFIFHFDQSKENEAAVVDFLFS